MATLIDGNNFLGCSRPQTFRDPQSRYELVAKLLTFQRVTRTRVIVVFDGPPDALLADERLDKPKFSILFPPAGHNADWLIREWIGSRKNTRDLKVVTSDRELAAQARSHGASVLSCSRFNTLLKEELTKGRRAREMTKDNRTPSPLEIGLWQDLFRGGKKRNS